MARLQATLQLLRGALLDIIVVASRHRATVDERRALVVSDAGGGFLLKVGHVVRSRACWPKIRSNDAAAQTVSKEQGLQENRGGGRNIT